MSWWDVRLTYAVDVPDRLRSQVRSKVPADTRMVIEYGSSTTTFHLMVEGDGGPDAIAEGLRLLAGVQAEILRGAAPEGHEAYTAAEARRRLAARKIPKLATLGDLRRMTGLSKTRVYQLAERDDFPRPVDTTAGGAIYREDDLLRFLSTWERKPGRGPGSKLFV